MSYAHKEAFRLRCNLSNVIFLGMVDYSIDAYYASNSQEFMK